jgi:hypothetical protein
MYYNMENLLGDMQKTWTSPIYGFFKPVQAIKYVGKRPFVEFVCAAKTCKKGQKVRRFLDTKDRASTSNLKCHAERCWGDETVGNSLTSDVNGVRKGLGLKKDGSIPAAFEAKGKGVVSFSQTPHTKEEIRYVQGYPTNT